MRAILCAAILAMTGCAPTSAPSPEPTVTDMSASPSPLASPPVTLGDVRDLFKARAAAATARDSAAFERTYDHDRAAFATCERETWADPQTATALMGLLQPQRIEAYGGYVIVLASLMGETVRYFARMKDGGLVLTEPQPYEIGESRTITDGPITVKYWAIDESVAPGLGAAARRAHDLALAEAPATTTVPFVLQLYPIHTLMSGASCWAAGTATLTDAAHPVVSIPVFNAGFDVSFHTPSSATGAVLIHEALHWVQAQVAFGANASAPWWLTEGWADRVSGVTRSATLRAMCPEGFPSLATIGRHGLGLYTSEPNGPDAEKQYAAAGSMVEYLFLSFDRARYWDLYRAIVVQISNERAFAATLAMSEQQFYDAWLIWARKTYC